MKKMGFQELIKVITDVLKEEQIHIKVKNIIPKCIVKIEVIVGHKLEYVNTRYLEQTLLGVV